MFTVTHLKAVCQAIAFEAMAPITCANRTMSFKPPELLNNKQL